MKWVLWLSLLAFTNSSLFYDVVVYRATPGGIAAAISAASVFVKRRILLLEASSHVGGMATEGGIGLRDGFEFVRMDPRNSQYEWGRRNARHYGIKQGVIWQPDHYVGEANFQSMLREAGVTVLLDMDFCTIRINGTKMEAIVLENGTWIEAPFFIDASYEGELMQASRVVDYTYGRESSSTYRESWA